MLARRLRQILEEEEEDEEADEMVGTSISRPCLYVCMRNGCEVWIPVLDLREMRGESRSEDETYEDIVSRQREQDGNFMATSKSMMRAVQCGESDGVAEAGTCRDDG